MLSTVTVQGGADIANEGKRMFTVSNRTTLRAAITAVAAVIAVGGGVIATAGATSEGAGNQLAGTWTATVDRPAPLPPIASLHVYTARGSMVESGNDSAARSPQYASWKRVGGRQYAATGIVFRFDPQTGAFLGKYKINRTIDLAHDGQSFTFEGRATLYNTNGDVVTSFPVSGSGQRLQVEEQS